MSEPAPIIFWFRHDLRLDDNPGLTKAAQTRRPLWPIFICSPTKADEWPAGLASQWWLHFSLQALTHTLQHRGADLHLYAGEAKSILLRLCHQLSCHTIYFNQSLTPYQQAHDQHLIKELAKHSISCHVFFDNLLLDPATTTTQQGTPYKVFTPFWKKHSRDVTPPPPLTLPKKLVTPDRGPAAGLVRDCQVIDKRRHYTYQHYWQPGSQGAQKQLTIFIHEGLAHYQDDRDFPALNHTSRLSPHLHFGEISPRQIWHQVQQYVLAGNHARQLENQAAAFLRQLYWRDFAYHLLHHFPHTDKKPLNTKFAPFPWSEDQGHLQAWQQGQTGYPLIDAGMRQLSASGFMHNRVRMLVASFLTKDLLLPWQRGAKWFWDNLVDADLANNTFGWQWSAGCGADAAPYFRIFNPVLQSKKFDAQGRYIKQWVPELQSLPWPWIHTPWLAPREVLQKANLKLGQDYPLPIIDHGQARKKALAIYKKL